MQLFGAKHTLLAASAALLALLSNQVNVQSVHFELFIPHLFHSHLFLVSSLSIGSVPHHNFCFSIGVGDLFLSSAVLKSQ